MSGEACPVCEGPLGDTPGYQRCNTCDAYTLVPRPTVEALSEHYRKMNTRGNYEASRRHVDANIRKFGRLIRAYLAEYKARGLPRPRAVLDIGCFTGDFLDAAAREGLDTLGFDPMVEAASFTGRQHRVWSGELDDGPVAPGTIGMIAVNDTLEHLLEPRATLAFAAKSLAPQGLLFVTTPDVHSWAGRLLGLSWGMFDGREHVTLYSRNAAKRLLESVGCRALSMRPHWKSLNLGYVLELGWHWQFRRPLGFPDLPGRIPLRVNVGEMLIVAARADARDS